MLLASIKASDCVGCGKCLPACPVDAIIGSSEFLHTVLTDECIGCGLCVAPCPMDCIAMVESGIPEGSLDKKERALKAKKRYVARQQRLLKEEQPKLLSTHTPEYKSKIREEIKKAYERAQVKKGKA